MEDHMKTEGNRRIAAYANDVEDVQILLAVDKDRFTRDQHDELGAFCMRACSAYFGLKANEERITNLVNNTMIGFPRRRVSERVVKLAQEAVAFCFGLVFGHEEYTKGPTDSLFSKEVRFH